MKIVVIGKSGQLATELGLLNSEECSVVCLGRNDVDISDVNSLKSVMGSLGADAVINASAYTAVDKAESDVENAFLLNEQAVKNIAVVCADLGINLVQVSTDFVFDGSKSSPYTPDDTCTPIGVYGESKLAGEKAAIDVLGSACCVIRTSWVYSVHGYNFVKTMLRLMNEREQLGVVGDQIGTPTHASSLAKICLLAAKEKLSGVHHYTDNGVASWYDFAVAICDIGLELGLLNKQININSIATTEYPTPAKRPSYSVLDKSSLLAALPDVSLVHWREELRSMMAKLKTLN
ncbi:dTDP-4-dehydrorhamnose reductase [Thalassotalea crassostreae]|uniref:dTDP-4-dehydrorhamnose reductase n=1 Tax=Thalassotalea crassostreae TaxID=1763536 RepID=UPI0008383F77|nr:dTDP-4-dehydrorhamnose reductase [Thalassotalea crassostreae]